MQGTTRGGLDAADDSLDRKFASHPRRRPATGRISEQRQEQLEKVALARLKRKTYAEIAEELGVSERTIKRWVRTSAFHEHFERLRREWVDLARARVQHWGDDVVASLYELAMHARSELVRYHALAKLGEWMGLGQQEDEKRQETTREELQQLYALIERQEQARQAERQLEAQRLLEELRQYQPSLPATVRELPVDRIELHDASSATSVAFRELQEAPAGQDDQEGWEGQGGGDPAEPAELRLDHASQEGEREEGGQQGEGESAGQTLFP